MKLIPKKVYVDSIGHTSEGISLYDYSDNRLLEVIRTCWFKEIHDLAKQILEERKEKLCAMDLSKL